MDTGGHNVMIAMPVYDSVKARTVEAAAGLAKSVDATLRVVSGTEISEARTELVEIAMRGQFTHVFFLDSDIICADDTILRLLEHDKQVVGAPYRLRGGKHPWAVYDRQHKPCNPARELAQVWALGTGCMLVRTDVFLLLDRPWFQYVQGSTGLRISDDVFFCARCEDAKVPVWCDGSISVGHIGEMTYA